MLFKTYAEELRNTPHRVSIVDPGAMRTRMRAAAMPGEDPMSLPPPDDISAVILYGASPDYDGIAQRLSVRAWREEGRI